MQKISNVCVLTEVEHGASMVGEFFSGGVCQKEHGENCSAEAVIDGKLTKVTVIFVCVCVFDWEGRQEFLKSSNSCVSASASLQRLHRPQCLPHPQPPHIRVSASFYVRVRKALYVLADDWHSQSRWSANLDGRVVMGLNVVVDFQGAARNVIGLESLVCLRAWFRGIRLQGKGLTAARSKAGPCIQTVVVQRAPGRKPNLFCQRPGKVLPSKMSMSLKSTICVEPSELLWAWPRRDFSLHPHSERSLRQSGDLLFVQRWEHSPSFLLFLASLSPHVPDSINLRVI